MSDEPIIIQEQYGPNGEICHYHRQGQNTIIKYTERSTFTNFIYTISTFFKQIVLPHGYPSSVSEDYLEYQVWDTIQAFCSTITSAFTTRAILKGVGVGNAEASALSATVAWILKDGAGMSGRILFAWWKGCDLDYDCKKWRFVADIINDIAMGVEIFLPFVEDYSLQVLCCTSVMKSIVGVAGGATRASITHHQAINENMAEISAIDGTQETIVNLAASILSLFLLNFINSKLAEFSLIIFLMIIHLFANYKAVKALVFKKFNRQRLAILLKSYYNVGVVLNPKRINSKESILFGGMKDVGLCGFKIKMGQSLSRVTEIYTAEDLGQILSNFEDKSYVLVPDIKKGIIHVGFEKTECAKVVIEAYFFATMLAIAICHYFDMDLDVNPKRYLHQTTPMSRLCSFMKHYQRHDHIHKIPVTFYSNFFDFINAELNMFFTVLDLKDWDLTSHDISIGDWRVQWKIYSKKLT